MAYQDRFYTIGTVSVQNGSAVVTGTGTGWETALIDGGVIFVGGGSYPIYSVESETSLTLAYPYTDASGADLPYAIDRQRAAATSNIQMNDRLAQIIREISIGNIEEINALEFTGHEILQTDATGRLIAVLLTANKLLRTDNSGNIAQSNLSAWAISMLGLTGTADRMPYLSAANSSALTPLTAFARSILDDGDASAVRGTIGAQASLGFTPVNKGGDTNVGAITMGVSSGLSWPANNGGNTAIFLGATNNDAGPTGVGYSRGIVFGNPAGFRSRLFFEIQHGNWHGLTVAVENSIGGVQRYSNFRSDGGFYSAGSINGTAKNFEIDHPADPNNYDLRHCATEAPEMLVEYRGTVRLVNGRAAVNVEEYFGVMTDTFSNLWADAWVMSLQNQDGFARLRPSRVNGVVFDIVCEDEASSDLVTWLVMARRNDPYVRWKDCNFTDDEGRLIIEFEKPE